MVPLLHHSGANLRRACQDNGRLKLSLQTPITFNSGVADSFRDVRKFKETRKHFERVREDVEIAQVKNAQAPRTKAHEVEEATCALSVARKCFRHLALDYVLQMLSFMRAQYSLFQQGYRRLEEADPYMKKLAAEVSEKLRRAWIQAVQASIASAYRESPDSLPVLRLWSGRPSLGVHQFGDPSRERSGRGDGILQRILCLPGNQQCCDCGQADPRWASINLGILLCIECSGIHRSLGVHCSKVRSLTLDSWEPELLKLMCELGNGVVKHIYEGSYHEGQGVRKATASSCRQEKEAWIKAKYVEKKFVKKLIAEPRLLNGDMKSTRRRRVQKCRSGPRSKSRTPMAELERGDGVPAPSRHTCGKTPINGEADHDTSDPGDSGHLHPGALLYRAARARNITEDQEKTPLIQAVIGGSLLACEFLLQNAADVNQRDARGRGPLHHATYLGHTGQVCLFLKRGAAQNDGDEDGHDPLSIAVQQANADIVTLLRLARMNEEMRESEGGFAQAGDATYLDIFREFSHMASHNPEKLKRRSVHFRHSFR
uniref:Arf-GAP with coiled-coil, ANK repeat and PH domain-containing protein n=1 Tax=Hippocampus comes TaxID=109280 RepID=A0A3Q2YY17_HIPCM